MSLYYLVPRFPTATFDVGSRLGAIASECVVPENIHNTPFPPPPRPHTHTHTHTHTNTRKATEIPRGGGGSEFFPGAPSKIHELLKTIGCSVEQVISYLTVNSLLKQ